MAIKYINIFQSGALQNLPKMVFGFENHLATLDFCSLSPRAEIVLAKHTKQGERRFHRKNWRKQKHGVGFMNGSRKGFDWLISENLFFDNNDRLG
jgi:hypothetical protein